jgi:hypothetical protein
MLSFLAALAAETESSAINKISAAVVVIVLFFIPLPFQINFAV